MPARARAPHPSSRRPRAPRRLRARGAPFPLPCPAGDSRRALKRSAALDRRGRGPGRRRVPAPRRSAPPRSRPRASRSPRPRPSSAARRWRAPSPPSRTKETADRRSGKPAAHRVAQRARDAPCLPLSRARWSRSPGPPCRASRRRGSGRFPPRPRAARLGNRKPSSWRAGYPWRASAREPWASSLQGGKIVKRAIEEVRGPHLGERARDGFDAPGVAFFPLAQHLGYNLALQILLGAAEGARNDRKGLLFGIYSQVFLGDVGKRTDDDVLSIIGAQLRRHGFQLAAMEEIQEERGQHVVAVMAERDLRRADLLCRPVQRAATQPRAERAHRLAFRNDALHHRVRVLLDDAERHAAAFEISRQYFGRES